MKKREVVYAPMTVCPNCGGMRCAVLAAIYKHKDGEDTNLIITTLIGIVAEVLSALPRKHDAESPEVVKALFVDRLKDIRAMPAGEGERVH